MVGFTERSPAHDRRAAADPQQPRIIGFATTEAEPAEAAGAERFAHPGVPLQSPRKHAASAIPGWRGGRAAAARLVARFSPGEWLRLGVAAGMLGLLLWSIDPGILFPSSLTGQINAPLLTLRAPIDGRVTFHDGRIGDLVERGAVLVRVQNQRDGGTRLADLKAQRQAATDRAGILRRRIDELQAFDKRLDAQTTAFASATIDRFAAQVAQAAAQVSRAQTGLENATAQLRRTEALTRLGFATEAQLDDHRAAARQAANDLQAQQSALVRLQRERSAAEQGVFIGDTYNNTPYSQQRRDELKLEISSLSAQLAEAEIQGRLLDAQIASEQKNRDGRTVAAVTAPGPGILWRVDVADGEFVKSGTALAQIADCDRLFMTLPLGSRSLDRLGVGQPVRVIAKGTPRALPAHIAALRAGADSEIRDTAVNMLADEKEQFRWIVTLDASSETGTLSTACPIGGTASIKPAPSSWFVSNVVAHDQRRVIRKPEQDTAE